MENMLVMLSIKGGELLVAFYILWWLFNQILKTVDRDELSADMFPGAVAALLKLHTPPPDGTWGSLLFLDLIQRLLSLQR